jgi:nucleoid DNA-binding protein
MAKYSKVFLLKEIAARANFNHNDVKIIWDTLEEIIQEIVLDHDELTIDGILHLQVMKRKPYHGVVAKTGKPMDYPELNYIAIRPSPKLKRILNAKSNPPEKGEIEGG